MLWELRAQSIRREEGATGLFPLKRLYFGGRLLLLTRPSYAPLWGRGCGGEEMVLGSPLGTGTRGGLPCLSHLNAGDLYITGQDGTCSSPWVAWEGIAFSSSVAFSGDS